MEQRGESTSQEKKYKGVRKRKWGKWVSEIRLPNSRDRIWLGSFDSPEKAARAFDAALFCLRGPRASFNFPLDPRPELPEGAADRALSPSEIQALATAFANQERPSLPGPASGNQRDDDDEDTQETNFARDEGMGSREGNEALDTMDWSFLDVLDPSVEPREFGYFHHVVDARNHYDNESSGNYTSLVSNTTDGNRTDHEIVMREDVDPPETPQLGFYGVDSGFSQSSFLWNF